MRILVLGGTNFVGRAVLAALERSGHRPRALIPPGVQNPALPPGVAVEAVLSAPDDPRGLRAALSGVDAVLSLTGAVFSALEEDPLALVRQAQTLAEAAAESSTLHIVHLSTLGAAPASAYPWFKAHGLAELALQRSGVPLTVFRSGLLFGAGDEFSTTLALLLHAAAVFPLPGGGQTLLHPLWVEDLAAALVLALEMQPRSSRVLAVGGPEHLSLRACAQEVARAVGLRRRFVGLSPAHARHLVAWLLSLFPHLPVSPLWLDYFAADRLAPPDTLPREFGLLPERFAHRLEHLRGVPWSRRLRRALFGGGRKSAAR